MESSEFSLSVSLPWYLSCRENFHGNWQTSRRTPISAAGRISITVGQAVWLGVAFRISSEHQIRVFTEPGGLWIMRARF
jgi:hypothetical protein